MTSSLHSLSCYRDSEGELVCSCVPILVQESPASERADGYTSMSRVELHNLESGGGASVVLNPSQARRSASSRLRR